MREGCDKPLGRVVGCQVVRIQRGFCELGFSLVGREGYGGTVLDGLAWLSSGAGRGFASRTGFKQAIGGTDFDFLFFFIGFLCWIEIN